MHGLHRMVPASQFRARKFRNYIMSSIQRYKKPGGFLQLLSLIETFGGQKREKFIEMVDAESHVWRRPCAIKCFRSSVYSLARSNGDRSDQRPADQKYGCGYKGFEGGAESTHAGVLYSLG